MKGLLALAILSASIAADSGTKPKLVLTIILDQFRYDYLTRFRGEFTSGFDRLLTKGAVFSNARFQQFPTVTAVGHSIVLTGAMPSTSGIIGNDWYDRDAGKLVMSVSDDSVRLLGGAGESGASPHRLLVSTVGDELKIASGGKSRVMGVSLKDRGAILTAGHSADAAYWFDGKTGRFVSSTFYLADIPGWVKEFNQTATSSFQGAEWLGHKLSADGKINSQLAATPFSNDLLESFAERAIDSEKLGQGPATDLLSVSFSGNDYVGHQYGPDSAEVRDITIRTDRLLDKLFRFIDGRIGMQYVVVVLTSDHGVAPMPEANASRRMPGGRMPPGIVQEGVQKALEQKYGAGKWILSNSEHSLYLSSSLIREKELNRIEVINAARDAIVPIPHVSRVYTREQLATGSVLRDSVGQLVMNGFNYRRGADIYILLEPYWIFGRTGTTHGTVYDYDTHVPVIFMGPGIRAGRYSQSIAVNDIAPTLAAILDVGTPSGSVGRVLAEILFER